MNFYKMTFNEISNEVERYNRVLMNQQALHIPLTPAQVKRWHSLNKAYKKIQCKTVI